MIGRILFTGTKSFWKTKNSVEVTIVEHADHDVFEIIVVDAIARFEATRVFLDALALYSKLEADDGTVQKGVPEITSESSIIVKTHTVSDKAVSTFICNHLFIKTYLPVSELMEIEVRSTYMEQEHNELMVPRPESLPPSASPASGTIFALSPMSPQSPDQEERRQPLIFARVSQGLPLSESDAQIWARFAQNKSQAELVDAMTKALTDRVPEDESVLHKAAHAAIMLPAQTPFPAPRLRSPSPANLPHDMILAAPSPPMATPTKLSADKSTGLPPLQPSAGSGSRRSRLQGLFGFSFGSNDPSPVSSAASSPASSRASSPTGIARPRRASRGTSDPAADACTSHAGVGFVCFGDDNKTDDSASRGSHNAHSRSSPLLGAWRDTLQRGLGLRSTRSYDDCASLNPTARMAFGAADEDEVGMAGGALAGLDIDNDGQPSGNWPTSSPSSTPGTRFGARQSTLSARRRTFDPESGAPVPPPRPSPSPGALAVKKQHRRTGSGSLLAGIAGPSNRVQPCAAWAAEDDTEPDQS